jgi:Tol biopolymer transport system component
MIPRILFLFIIVVTSCEKITSPINNYSTPAPHLLFSSQRYGVTIVVSDIDGNIQFPLTQNWEDQEYASFVSKEGDIIYSAFLEGSKSRSIYKYKLNEMKIIRLTDDSGKDSDPCISNDGTMLTFTSNRNSDNNQWNIFTLNLQTKKIKQITSGTYHYIPGNHYHNPRFSPDGSKILFSEFFDGLYHISIIDTNASNYDVLIARKKSFFQFQFSVSGNKIYFTTYEVISDTIYEVISTCNLDGSGKFDIVSDSNSTYGTYFTNPVDTVLFYSSFNYLTDNYQLCKLNLLSMKKSVIKESSETINFGDCSKDGSKILYQQYINGKGDIFLLNFETGLDKNITKSEYHDQIPKFNHYLF